MRILLVFILTFGMSGWAADQSAIDSCELNASPRARVLSRFVEIGLQEQYFNAEEIAEFVASPEFYNPYVRYSKSEKTLALRNGFDRASIGVTLNEIAELKQSLVALAQQLSAQVQDVALAQKETKQILAPRVLRQLDIPGYSIRHTPLDLTWQNGRPLFVTRMDEERRNSNRTMAVVLDPFNSRVANRVKGVPKTSGNGNPKGNFEFFERKGIPYAVDFRQSFYINLKSKENEASTAFRRRYRSAISLSVESVLVKGPEFVRVVSIEKYGQNEEKLIAVDLLSPQTDPKILVNKAVIKDRPPVAFYVDSKAYVAYASEKVVHIYDATEDKMLAPIGAKLDWRKSNHLAIYSDEGAHYLALAEQAARSKMRIRIVDLKTREEKLAPYRFEPIGDIGFTLIEGIPYLHFFADDNLNIFNLRTRKLERIPVPYANDLSHFTWSGREYLIWAGEHGELFIFDLGARSLHTIANLLPPDAHQVTPFTFRGHTYALVAIINELPYLVRLTANGHEVER